MCSSRPAVVPHEPADSLAVVHSPMCLQGWVWCMPQAWDSPGRRMQPQLRRCSRSQASSRRGGIVDCVVHHHPKPSSNHTKRVIASCLPGHAMGRDAMSMEMALLCWGLQLSRRLQKKKKKKAVCWRDPAYRTTLARRPCAMARDEFASM